MIPPADHATGDHGAGANTGQIRLALVDDHTIVREGLRSVLELEADLTVVAEASEPAGALRVIADLSPDIVLLDLKLGERDAREGLHLCSRISAQSPEAKVIVLTTFEDADLLSEAVRCGARAYVLKDVDTDELVRIIRAVRSGTSGFDARSAALVIEALGRPAPPAPPAISLTPREVEILRLMANGLTNREISERTYLSESTVKFHLRSAMGKLGVHRRAEAVYLASRNGLL